MMLAITKMDAATPLPDFDAMRGAIPEARDVMRTAMQARDVPAIEQIFARVKHVRAQAAASEVLHRQEENIESQHAAHEMRVDVECLLGQWLIETEKNGLRFMGRSSMGSKAGTPPDPGLITLKKLGISRRESSAWQDVARLSPAEFQALRADLTAGPTIARFSATKSHRRRRDIRGGTGTDLLAVPKSVPSTLRELAKLHRDINKAETYKALRQIERKAEALKKLYADIDVIRVEAGKVIVFANHRIGVEMVKLPPAKGAAEKGTNRGTTRHPEGAASLKEQVGSKNRGLRLKKLGSQDKSVVEAVTEKLADEGKDVTVNSVLKTIAAEEMAKKRNEASRTAAPQSSDPAPERKVEAALEPAAKPVTQGPVSSDDDGTAAQAPSLAPNAETAPTVASTDPAPPRDLHGLHCAAVLDTIRGTIRGLTDQVAAIPANQLLEVRGKVDEVVDAALELRAVITRAIESAAVGEETRPPGGHGVREC
jgi:hypothetical protein